MNFNSLSYLVFLLLNVPLYYLLPKKLKNVQLLLASYFFYMCWNPKYALLMLFSTAVTYFCGLLVERSALGKRKLWLFLSFFLNLSVLFFFKYFNFASGLFQKAFTALGLSLDAPLLNVLLPVGISFYTFQALGYTMDVYRGDVKAERSFLNYALFVSFFPQLVAGPIERSGNILGQIKSPHPFRLENLRDGMLPILWGLFKKMVLADNLAVLVNSIYNAPQDRTGAELLLATFAFAIQIYCDFSAYSDIARGSAKLLGFTLMENFRCPYFAVSIKDFWRRWHISLSSWFKDYLYFPLGGSRCSKSRHLLNLMIVFAVSGLWHGAALTFVAWGLLNGLYQVVSELLQPIREKLFAFTHIKENSRWLHLFRVGFTFCLVCAAWVLFRANSLSDAAFIYQSLLSLPKTGFSVSLSALGLSLPSLCMLGAFTVLLFVVDWLTQHKDLFRHLNRTVVLRYAVYFLLIAAILIFGSYGVGYDPQDFAYFQF